MKNSRNATALWMSVSGSFLNLLYPRRCPLCHQILNDRKRLLCPVCEKTLRPVSGPRCFLCGKPVGEEEEYCPDCAAGHREFDQGRGIFLYDNKMKASLMKYKYFGSREYGQFYAKAMYTFAGKTIAKWKPDVLISVPLHPKKLRKRGFNQAGYLAKLLSGYTGIPFEEHLVRKTRETRAQKKLDAGARRKNLQDAFEASDRVKGLTLLVIDDVYTTGSTMDAMAGCLKKKGADKVYFLTVCIGIT